MRLLVIRTSAMGDVALTLPVLAGFRKQYPGIEILMLTRPAFSPFFPSYVKVFPLDLKKRHRGLSGIARLYNDINREYEIDHVIDLHNVLRSRILRFFFRLSGVPVSVIKKGRTEKRALISGKKRIQLRHTVFRYCDVFLKAGFIVTPLEEKVIHPSNDAVQRAESMMGKGDFINIGIAPFARHNLKMWPQNNMIGLVKLLSDKFNCRFWLFGGPEDREATTAFASQVPGINNVVASLSLEEELAVMSRLDLMIAMDSSNMHMASMTGIKVISIWGGTDPLTGFGAWMQPDSFSIRIPTEELKCRPCTVYGKGECLRGDFACMHWLTPGAVFKKIVNLNILPDKPKN